MSTLTWTYDGLAATAEGPGFHVRVFPASAGGGWNGRIRYLPGGHEETAHYGDRGEALTAIERQLVAEGLVLPLPSEETSS
jgi:hypothetical protein